MTATPRRAGDTTGHAPATFVVLLLMMSLPFWVLGFVAPSGLLPYGLPVSALMTFVPMLVAIILTARRGGWRSTKTLLGRAFDVRRIAGARLLLLAVSIMPVVAVSSWFLMRLLGYPLPSPHIAWIALPAMLLVYVVGAVGEEIGWTGYLTDPLQRRFGELPAALIIGAVWQAWHIVPFYAMGRSVTWISAQFVAGVLLRIIIVRLYNQANRSVFIAIVFHTCINVSFSLFPNEGSHFDPVTTAISLVAVVVTVQVVTYEMTYRSRVRATARPG